MKLYNSNSSNIFNLFTYKCKIQSDGGATPLAQIISEYCLAPTRRLPGDLEFIYSIFEDVKIKYKDFDWAWDENWEHYEMEPIILFLNKIWNDLDIKKEILIITSDIHIDYSDIFPWGDYYFTLHNMLLHHRMNFSNRSGLDCKYKFFLQGGSLRQDRTYFGEQFKKFVPDEFYISTISKNTFNQGADKFGKMKYTYDEMFGLFYDASIMIVNETIRPDGVYFETDFQGTATGYTEKTGNAIVFKKPFFLNSNPFSLYNLRELGFKTFGNIWDESYDEVSNGKDRINLIMENVKWLSKINSGGFSKLAKKTNSITEYNYNHLVYDMNDVNQIKLFKPSEFNFKLHKSKYKL